MIKTIIIKYISLLFLLIIISSDSFAQDTTIIKIDELSFKLPDKDWKIKSEKNKKNQITIYKEKVSILSVIGSSIITVYKESLSDEACLKTSKELIDSIINNEIQLLKKDAKFGRFVLLDTCTTKVTKYGKEYFTLNFKTKITSTIPYDGDNIIYIYFPDNFKDRKVYYGLVINEYIKENTLFSENDLKNIEPVLQSLKIEEK